MKERFDGKGYRDCKWCYGKGCAFCPGEADRAYKAAFPDGPVPMATFDITTTAGVAAARAAIGREAVTKAFRPGGGGIDEITDNCAKADKLIL